MWTVTFIFNSFYSKLLQYNIYIADTTSIVHLRNIKQGIKEDKIASSSSAMNLINSIKDIGYYDTVSVTYKTRSISFIEYLNSLKEEKDLDKVFDVELSHNPKTASIEVEGNITTSIENDVTRYHIANLTLVGKDEDNSIDSLTNNTRVKISLVYDNSEEQISQYKIIKAYTLS